MKTRAELKRNENKHEWNDLREIGKKHDTKTKEKVKRKNKREQDSIAKQK